VQDEVWNLRVHDVFCLSCDNKLDYTGYEKGSALDQDKIIKSENYETDDYESHYFLNFECPHCKNKISVMTH